MKPNIWKNCIQVSRFKHEKEIEAKIEATEEISVALADEPEAKQWLAHLEQSKKAFNLTKEAVALRAQFCAVEVVETEDNSVKLEQVEQAEIDSEERNQKLEGIKQVSGQIKEISDHLKESLVSQNQYLSGNISRISFREHWRLP